MFHHRNFTMTPFISFTTRRFPSFTNQEAFFFDIFSAWLLAYTSFMCGSCIYLRGQYLTPLVFVYATIRLFLLTRKSISIYSSLLENNFLMLGLFGSFFATILLDDHLCYIAPLVFITYISFRTTQFLHLIYKRFRPTLQPQMGLSEPMDVYLKEAILLSCLVTSLADSKSKKGRIAVITMYLQAHVDTSLLTYLYTSIVNRSLITDWSSVEGSEQISEMLEDAFSLEGSDSDDEMTLSPHSDDGDWSSVLDGAFVDWKKFRHSSLMKSFSRLTTIIVSAGLCSAAAISFKIGDVDLFAPVVESKQIAAVDVFDAFFETVVGFVKGGWRVFHTGDITTFYRDNQEYDLFDTLYNQVRQAHSYALAGNLSDIDTNESDYVLLLEKAIKSGETLLKKTAGKQSFERNYISIKLDKIRDHDSEFAQVRTKGGLRKSPFSISLFGSSGSGKSSLTKLSLRAGLLYNGLDDDERRIMNWADNDKYASGLRSHSQAIIFDDFANTVSQFQDFSPAYRLIQVINNVKYTAPMADLHLKGKVSFNPHFCMVTTNVKDLKAVTYSNEPESILRRLYHVTVTPRPEFCTGGRLDDDKVIQRFGVAATPDIWMLRVEYYDVQNSCQIYNEAFKVVMFEEKPMDNINIFTYLRWVQIASKAHFAGQDQYLKSQGAEMSYDPSTCLYGQPSKDSDYFQGPEASEPGPPEEKHPLQPHSGLCSMFVFWNRLRAFNQIMYGIILPFFTAITYFKDRNAFRRNMQKLTADIRSFGEGVAVRTAVEWTTLALWWRRFDILPESWIVHPTVTTLGLFFWRKELHQSLVSGLAFIWIMALVSCLTFQLPISVFLAAAFASYTYVTMTMRTYKALVSSRIRDCKNVIKTYTDHINWKYALLGAGAIALVSLAYRRHRGLAPQADLNPTSMKDVLKRNDEANPWLVPEVEQTPTSAQSASTTPSNLSQMMRTNMIGIGSESGKSTLAFCICSNVLILPRHFMEFHHEHGVKDIKITGYRTGKKESSVGHMFSDVMLYDRTIFIPGTDFALVYITAAGALKDFRKYLPITSTVQPVEANLLSRGITDKIVCSFKVLFEGTSMVSHTESTFVGGYYNTPLDTHNGMCMSPLISNEMAAVIIGFHLGGRGKRAGCGILTQSQVATGLSRMAECDGVVLTASMGENIAPHMGDFPSTTYDQKIITDHSIHRKSPTRFLEKGANIAVFGTTFGRVSAHSSVIPTIISDSVASVMKVAQKWGPPAFKGRGVYPFQASLEHSANPCKSIGSVLSRAVACYKTIATKLKKEVPEIFEDARPNTDIEALCGKVGERFNDAMNWGTSPGFGLSGKKEDYAIDLDPELHPNVGRPRTFPAEIWEAVEEAKEKLRSGERCYFLWKACLKDEPTKIGKDKVRVFQSAPIVAQILVRTYFLPIIRIIQLFPLHFECAVGINAVSHEWEQMWTHAIKHGKERILAGDYSKYDLTMSAQLTIAAFDVLISIAKLCPNYSDDDIHMMEMIVSEIVYPVVAYNGDLIQFFGTNPSGQNLTVIINSIVNSLLLRSAYYTIIKPVENDFCKMCSFITYGDDVMGSVHASRDAFNHISYAAWLKEIDMIFTMPDKTSTPTKYMSEKDCDFLKRKNVYNPDLGTSVGALDESSIFKRLHSHLESKFVGPRMHAVVNMSDALSDWFFHGEEMYTRRQQQLFAIAQEHDLVAMCNGYGMSLTYAERVEMWHQKYNGKPVPMTKTEVPLEPHCGSDTEVFTEDLYSHCKNHRVDPRFYWEYYLCYVSIVGWLTLAYANKVRTIVLEIRIDTISQSWFLFLFLCSHGTLGRLFFMMEHGVSFLLLRWTYLYCRALFNAVLYGEEHKDSREPSFSEVFAKSTNVTGLDTCRADLLKRFRKRRRLDRPVPTLGAKA